MPDTSTAEHAPAQHEPERGHTPPEQPRHIHREIARLAREAHGTTSTAPEESTVLAAITDYAVRLLPGVDHAGVTMVRKRHQSRRGSDLESVAATTSHASLFDTLQHHHVDGPCFAAIWDHDTVTIPDMTAETRWPDFTGQVVDRTPIRSTLSVQLYIDNLELGALNLHSGTPYAFVDHARDTALIFATHAAIAVDNARRSRQFLTALASRDVITRAKGIIMERFTIDADQAFDLLKKLSQDSNVTIADIARRLIDLDHPTPTHIRQPGTHP